MPEPAPPSAPEPAVVVTTLREALATTFSLSELEIVCVDLGVKPDSVPQHDNGIDLWAMEIVAYFQRRNRLNELVAYCAKERPGLQWQSLADAYVQLQARDASSFSDIQQGITALGKLAQDPNARPIIMRVRDDLQDASDNITRLSTYKRLHDEFQELQVRYSVIERDCQTVVSDESAWNTLSEYLTQWDGIMNNLLTIVKQSSFTPNEVQWMTRLAQAQRDVQSVLGAQNAAPLKGVLLTVSRMLEREPSLINAKLFEVVRGMLQRSVIPSLIELRDALAERHVDTASLNQFAQGIESLKGLRDQLQVLVTDHDRWQNLEDELNPIASNLSRSPDVLEQSWPYVGDLAHEMFDGLKDDWALALVSLNTRIQDLLAAKDAARVRPFFYQFNSRVSNRFRVVNDDLLKVIEELQKIGDSLQLFLRTIL